MTVKWSSSLIVWMATLIIVKKFSFFLFFQMYFYKNGMGGSVYLAWISKCCVQTENRCRTWLQVREFGGHWTGGEKELRRTEARSGEYIAADRILNVEKGWLSVWVEGINLFGPGLRKKLHSCFGIHMKTCVGLSREMGVRLVEMLG